MTRSILFSLAAVALFTYCTAAPVIAAAQPVSGSAPHNPPTAPDELAIRKLLDIYTASVSNGNRVAFESQLLDLKIPFAYVQAGMKTTEGHRLAPFQDYASFRKVIFDSGKHYQQRFSHISIEQVLNLAQVSLDYQTALQGSAYEGTGWKVMQLIKLNGQWKIASEFFTGYEDK